MIIICMSIDRSGHPLFIPKCEGGTETWKWMLSVALGLEVFADTAGTACDSCSHTSRFKFRLSNTCQIEKTRSRTLKMTCLLIFSFICCWTPLTTTEIWYLTISNSADALDTRIQSYMYIIAVFNFCVNPLVYGSYFLNFKATLRNLVHWNLRINCKFRKSSSQLEAGRRFKDPLNVELEAGKMFKDPLNVETGLDSTLSTSDGIYLELQPASPVRQRINRGVHHDLHYNYISIIF
ncbi:g_PROTEIN_RECEP_F1_2 domain-containing protein [Nephila pilipes]|uniref:G_PROTEIN_RECEP_F1_2 domain-containing protein n=1 Tax=Nephila pilipes TaxID=299642 RepID=A0A8X6U7U9_NEPPI|nr:g_PROTEIN_RECEP_F1_2 domain-containing protein [Nephila pilipes]